MGRYPRIVADLFLPSMLASYRRKRRFLFWLAEYQSMKYESDNAYVTGRSDAPGGNMVKFRPRPKRHWRVVVDEIISKHSMWAIPCVLLTTLYLWSRNDIQSMSVLNQQIPLAILITAVLIVAYEGFKRSMDALDRWDTKRRESIKNDDATNDSSKDHHGRREH